MQREAENKASQAFGGCEWVNTIASHTIDTVKHLSSGIPIGGAAILASPTATAKFVAASSTVGAFIGAYAIPIGGAFVVGGGVYYYNCVLVH